MKFISPVSVLAVSVLAFAGCGKNAGHLHPLLEAPPSVVVEAIEKELGGGQVDDVDLRTGDGEPVYVIDIEMPDETEKELEISRSGEILRTRTELVSTNLPAPIAQTVQEHLPAGGTIDEAVEVVTGGSTSYRVEIEQEGQPDLNLVISDSGSVLSATRDDRPR